MMMMNDFQRRLYEMQQKKKVIQTPADTEALGKFWQQHQALQVLLAQLDASKEVETHANVAIVFIELMKRGSSYQTTTGTTIHVIFIFCQALSRRWTSGTR